MLANVSLSNMPVNVVSWISALCLLAAAGKKLCFYFLNITYRNMKFVWTDTSFHLTPGSRRDAEYTRREDVNGNQCS